MKNSENPTFISAYNFHQSNDFESALKEYQKILEQNPDNAEVINLIGNIYFNLKQYQDAEEYTKKAISIEKNDYFFIQLGKIHLEKQEFKSAINDFQSALSINKYSFDAWVGLADSLKGDLQFEKSIICYETADKIKPSDEVVLYNLAHVYLIIGDIDKSLELYEKLHKINPYDLKVKYYYGTTLMQAKQYKKGFSFFESRLCRYSAILTQEKSFPEDFKIKPLWNGEDISGKKLFTYYEAGYGDMIMFARYLPILKEKNINIIFFPQKPLAELFKENPLGCSLIVDDFVRQGSISFDYHIPMMSIPHILGIDGNEVFRLRNGYIKPNEEKSKYYKEKFFNNDSFKIAIKWQGNVHYAQDRTIDVLAFLKLFDIPNIKLYSFQTFAGSEELDKIPKEYEIIDVAKTFNNFSDTAAALDNVDLVISSDSSLVHLSGAMGINSYVLLPYEYNWRWHTDLSYCDWYSSVKILRQDSPFDWNGVFDKLIFDLKNVKKY